MATTLVAITAGPAWVKIADGKALFKIQAAGTERLYVSHDQDEATARAFPYPDKVAFQFSQFDNVPTYARTDGEGWLITVSPQGGGQLADVGEYRGE